MAAEMSEVFVKCPGCGQHNKLRIAVDAPYERALTHEEQFMAYIRQIVNELGGVLTSREIARQVANRVLGLFCDWDQAPPYRIQVFRDSDEGWHTIKTIALHSL